MITYITHFLDPHLVFPLLKFLSMGERNNEKELLHVKLDLLKVIHMTGFATDVYKNLSSDDIPRASPEERKDGCCTTETASGRDGTNCEDVRRSRNYKANAVDQR